MLVASTLIALLMLVLLMLVLLMLVLLMLVLLMLVLMMLVLLMLVTTARGHVDRKCQRRHGFVAVLLLFMLLVDFVSTLLLRVVL